MPQYEMLIKQMYLDIVFEEVIYKYKLIKRLVYNYSQLNHYIII